MSKRKNIISALLCALLTICFYFNMANSTAAASGITEEPVYIGGFPIAFVLKVDGVIVEKEANGFEQGDILQAVNGVKVTYAHDISQILSQIKEPQSLNISLLRDGKNIETEITPLRSSGGYILGVPVREDCSGIGMVTYIKENGNFASLGHKIIDSVSGEFPFLSGKIYNCEIIGLKKSKKGAPGEIRGVIKGNPIGDVYKNTNYGVFGKFYSPPTSGEKFYLESRNEVLPGNAEIVTTLNDERETFDAEIIKPLSQLVKSNKGMVIRITDKDLINRTGGILQGMSGSPILQNGKIIGAVTHVFINDPLKGYGIYSEWMNCII